MFGQVLSYCTTWPRTLHQQHLGEGVDWELMRQTCPESRVTFNLLNVLCFLCRTYELGDGVRGTDYSSAGTHEW